MRYLPNKNLWFVILLLVTFHFNGNTAKRKKSKWCLGKLCLKDLVNAKKIKRKIIKPMLTNLVKLSTADIAKAKVKLTKTNYDFILEIGTMKDLVADGWKVTSNEIKLKGAIVAVSGLFNRGKTWFLNKLSKFNFEYGLLHSTRGLSLKQFTSNNKNNNLVLLDTAGNGAPVDSFAESQYYDKVLVEEITNTIILQLSDYFIFVINEITWHDQYHIATTLQQKYLKHKLVIVVHNLKDTKLKYFTEHYTKYISPFLQHGKQVAIKTKNKLEVKPFWVSTNEFGFDMRHVFLVKERSKSEEFNEATLDLIRFWLFNLVAPTRINEELDTLNTIKVLIDKQLEQTFEKMEFTCMSGQCEPIDTVEDDNNNVETKIQLINNEAYLHVPLPKNRKFVKVKEGNIGLVDNTAEDIDYEMYYSGDVERPDSFYIIISASGISQDDLKEFKIDIVEKNSFILTGVISPVTSILGPNAKKLDMYFGHNTISGKVAVSYNIPPKMKIDYDSINITLEDGFLIVSHHAVIK